MSQTSLGMSSGGYETDESQSGTRILVPVVNGPSDQCLYDCIAFVIFCKQHKTIALSVRKIDGLKVALWLPFVPLSATQTWERSSAEGIRTILNKVDPELEPGMKHDIPIPIENKSLFHTLTVETTSEGKIITHLIYFVKLEKSRL